MWVEKIKQDPIEGGKSEKMGIISVFKGHMIANGRVEQTTCSIVHVVFYPFPKRSDGFANVECSTLAKNNVYSSFSLTSYVKANCMSLSIGK